MTKKNTASTRSTWKWTPEQLEFLAERPSMPRDELEKAFRKAYPEFTGTQQAIVGRRYGLIHRGSKVAPEASRTALEARIAELEDELAQARERLANLDADEATDVPSVDKIVNLPMDEVRSLADRFGVKKSGGKKAIAERIHEVA